MQDKKKHSSRVGKETGVPAPHVGTAAGEAERKKLEVVVKCDSVGSLEAVNASLASLKIPNVKIEVIQSGVGPVSKSDLMMALTGSRLVVGFQVNVMPRLETFVRESGVEVRLYVVIYNLINDVKKIAQSLIEPEVGEKIKGQAKVIALFKIRRGIVLGCEVQKGTFDVGSDFRIITAMGPVHFGKIESLQIERQPVKQATAGQQVGLKVTGFDGAKVGDLVECYETVRPSDSRVWRPAGRVIHPATPE